MRVIFYQTARTKVPVLEFINVLDKKDQVKILACLKSIEDLGFYCPRVQFRQIKGKLWEIKIKATTSSYRVFYVAIHGDILILLHAYKKQSQRAPKKEIIIAEKRLFEVLNNESYYIN